MHLITFNPFSKDIELVTATDLLVLKDVAEGWYIEYKSEAFDTKKIGKSLAAFANHYGGWIFYGVKGAKDGSNRAESFPGFEKHEVSLLIERIRNAAKDIINPSPYYEHKIVDGPCHEIGLNSDKSIVIVAIPSGIDTPYIHADGRIYRRIADSSDPKPETDRFTLDFLWQRGQRRRDKLTAFLEIIPILSGQDDETSFIDLFLLPDPLGASGQQSKLDFPTFRELMKTQRSPGFHIPCDNFYTMSEGYIARQINNNNPYRLVLTWRHYFSGFSIISIPFSSIKITQLNAGHWLYGYEQEQAMIDIIKQGQNKDSYLVDLNQLIVVIVATIAQQRQLMKNGLIKGLLYAKVALHNIGRRIPFIDTETYIDFVHQNGLPVIQSNGAFAPPGKTFETLRMISEKQGTTENEQELLVNQYVEAFSLIADTLDALGLPREVILTKLEQLLLIDKRASEVNHYRSQVYEGLTYA